LRRIRKSGRKLRKGVTRWGSSGRRNDLKIFNLVFHFKNLAFSGNPKCILIRNIIKKTCKIICV